MRLGYRRLLFLALALAYAFDDAALVFFEGFGHLRAEGGAPSGSGRFAFELYRGQFV